MTNFCKRKKFPKKGGAIPPNRQKILRDTLGNEKRKRGITI